VKEEGDFMYTHRLRFIGLALTLLMLSTAGQAKTKTVKAVAKDPQDEIQVVGHLPVTGGPVTRFMVTQHYSSTYLYAEHETGANITLVDVTKVNKPVVLADVAYPASGGSGSLFAVAGTAALVTEPQSASVPTSPSQNIRIMDFSDPQHPKVAREFAGVTAIISDHGLIFLANADGIWILRKTLAEDPEVEKAYAHQVLYQ
jgi:hypothetical protein